MYYDDNDQRPKWDRPEIEDWDDDEDLSRITYGCTPNPNQCWPRPCWPRQQCWPRQHCWPHQPQPCWPHQQCWPRR